MTSLGPLNEYSDAQRWAEAALIATASGTITASQAQAVRSLLTEWRAAHESGHLAAQLKALTAALSDWRRTGDPASVLKLVEGGRTR